MSPRGARLAVRPESQSVPVAKVEVSATEAPVRCIPPHARNAANKPRFLSNLAAINPSIAAIASVPKDKT
jgi:hypothetical protein